MTDKGPALTCLAGRSLPSAIATDAESAARLTRTAIDALWEVLEPSLGKATQGLAVQLKHFCSQHEVAEADLGRTIRASRYLLRQASAMDLDVERFADDAVAVFATAPEVGTTLVGRYDRVRLKVREELFLTALLDHGAVLENVAWRVDYVAASSDAPKLRSPVALLTFHYREGERTERLSLQLTPPMLYKLQQICGQLVSQTDAPPSSRNSPSQNA